MSTAYNEHIFMNQVARFKQDSLYHVSISYELQENQNIT